MDTPVQDIIVGNIPGVHGPDTDIKPRDVKYTSQCIVDTPLSTDKQLVETVPETDCLAECAHLTITVSQIEQDIGRKSSFLIAALHSTHAIRWILYNTLQHTAISV